MYIQNQDMQQKSSKNIDIRELIGGMKLFSGSAEQLLIQIKNHLQADTKATKKALEVLTIATPNPEILIQAINDNSLASDLAQFSLRIPDGVGLLYAANLLGTHSSGISRIPGVEIVAEILSLAGLASKSVFLVGGRGYSRASFGQWDVQDVTVASDSVIPELENRKKLLWHYGFLESSDQSTEENNSIRRAIEAAKPSVVFVALGAPNQERWVINNQDWLKKAGVRVVMVVGGAFDMLFGKIPRAPEWIRRIGFEWLFRLYQEPSRWRRQLRLLHFIYIVGRSWLQK